MFAALSLYTYSSGRATLRDSRAFPAVYLSEAKKNWIAQGVGFPEHKVRQIVDGIALKGVINMAGLTIAADLATEERFLRSLQNGERLSVMLEGGKVVDFKVEWMPAAQRITLGIPLHPDRMKSKDWVALNGIGEKLAERIESDRHKSGDFGSLDGLERVRGIGNMRIESWRKYF